MHASTILVHNGAMRMANKTIRQSVSLPAGVAAQVRSLAKTRRLSANRMLVELIEDGMESQTGCWWNSLRTEWSRRSENSGSSSTWPNAFAALPIRKKRNGWGMSLGAWYSAADA